MLLRALVVFGRHGGTDDTLPPETPPDSLVSNNARSDNVSHPNDTINCKFTLTCAGQKVSGLVALGVES